MAFTNAIKRLAETLSQELSVQPQFSVLLRSFPADDELLNEAHFLLRDSFQLDIDFDHEWKSRLSADEQQSVFGNQGLIPPSIIEKLCSQIQRQQILLVTVEAVDQVDGIYHYQATGQVYQAGQRKPAYTVVSRGFSRDLQNQIPPILLTYLIFFLICLLITGLIRLSGSSGYSLILSSMGQDLLAVGLSFLIGAILPQILVAMLDGFRPDGDTPPLFAFWWSSLFGLLLLVLPIALHCLVLARRLPESVRVQLSNRGGLVCLTLAMGGCTCLISPACLYFQLQAWQILVPAALISASLGYFFGWTLDDSTIPAAAIGIPITASIPYGIACTYANPYLLWALLATSSLTVIFIWQRFYLRTREPQKTDDSDLVAATLTTSGHLEGRFQSCQDLVGLMKKLDSQADPVSVHLYRHLPTTDQPALSDYLDDLATGPFRPPPNSLRNSLIDLLNQQLEQIDLFDPQRFVHLDLSSVTIQLVDTAGAEKPVIRKRNQQLLIEAFPNEIGPLDISSGPSDIEELKKSLSQPRYIHTRSYEKALILLSSVLSKQSVFLSLIGVSGMGKTATAQALFQTLKRQAESSGQSLTVLSGHCSQPQNDQMEGDSSPFQPFQRALAEVFSIDLFASVKGQIEKLDQALDGLFESIIPFANLLFPHSEETEAQVGSSSELFVSIERTLRHLSGRGSNKSPQPIILFIDDVQWIDSVSRDLLQHLISALQEEPAPVSIVLTCRDSETVEALNAGIQLIDLGADEDREEEQAEYLRILTGALNLHPLVAERVLGEIGDLQTCHGAFHWLLCSLTELAGASAFKFENGTFTWSPDFQQYAEPQIPLPISTQIEASITQLLDRVATYRPILDCAACIGLEFRVSVLAQGLEMSRLEVLQQLSEIEEQTDLIYDLRRSDDVFAFRSSVNLEVIRQRSGIRIQGPTKNGMAQIMREYHARIAKVLADQYPQEVYSIADHFYTAGLACSEEAIDACLRAAQAALKQFAVTDARRYLDMIEEYQQVADHRPREVDLIRLSADLAHISGQDRATAAEEGLTFLSHAISPAVDMMLLAARSCYDAGTDEREQRYFAQAVRLGQLTADNPTANRLQQAEGLHFVGISLPVSEPQQRESYLRQSLDLISDAPTEDVIAQRLLARIHNSLARQLESTSPTEAKSFYQRSLEIKQRLSHNPQRFRSPGFGLPTTRSGNSYLPLPTELNLCARNG